MFTMSEQTSANSTPSEEPKINRPRRSDGTFMSNTEIEALDKQSKDAFSHLKENNKALMQGTGLDENYFKGMDDLAINKFLLNFHSSKKDEKPSEPVKEPNTPILGTPIGSGHTKYFIDKYLKIDPKEHTVEFEAPGSVVFAHHKNKEEAEKKWLDRL